jgi:hypothetical protein
MELHSVFKGFWSAEYRLRLNQFLMVMITILSNDQSQSLKPFIESVGQKAAIIPDQMSLRMPSNSMWSWNLCPWGSPSEKRWQTRRMVQGHGDRMEEEHNSTYSGPWTAGTRSRNEPGRCRGEWWPFNGHLCIEDSMTILTSVRKMEARNTPRNCDHDCFHINLVFPPLNGLLDSAEARSFHAQDKQKIKAHPRTQPCNLNAFDSSNQVPVFAVKVRPVDPSDVTPAWGNPTKMDQNNTQAMITKKPVVLVNSQTVRKVKRWINELNLIHETDLHNIWESSTRWKRAERSIQIHLAGYLSILDQNDQESIKLLVSIST